MSAHFYGSIALAINVVFAGLTIPGPRDWNCSIISVDAGGSRLTIQVCQDRITTANAT